MAILTVWLVDMPTTSTQSVRHPSNLQSVGMPLRSEGLSSQDFDFCFRNFLRKKFMKLFVTLLIVL
jgi:hypothetical protein